MSDEYALDIDLREYLQIFIADADDNLSTMEQNLLRLESDASNGDAIAAIFRAAHTIKGNATLIGFSELGEFAHLLETVLDELRSGRAIASAEMISSLLIALDTIRAFTVELAGDPGARFNADLTLRDRLQCFIAKTAGEPSPATPEPRPLAAEGGGAAPERETRTLRVPVDRLDVILNLTSEITISRGRERALLQNGRTRDAHEAHQEADRLYAQLRDEVAKLRLVPIGPVFRRLRRLIRDVAQLRDKKVRVEFEGDDVELDTSMIEHLMDPLMHMVRNAVDHGLETPEQRIALDKPEVGVIWLRALYETGNVVIRLEDDGRGLERDRIIARGLERGLVTGGEQLTEQDVFALIFEPGFSTADVVTELSGRGVGLDVVKRNVEALRGTISVSSSAGRGTCFSIRVPLTVATIDGFNVEAGGETFVLPLDYVVECVELPRNVACSDARGAGVFNLRGAAMPFIRLAQIFGNDAPNAPRESAVIVQNGDARMALVVETLRGEAEAVIKPLGRLLGNVPGLSGSTILGSGRIGLIVDVPALLQRACTSGANCHA